MMPLSIAGTVGRDWRNDPDDVGTVAGVLGDLGYVSALPSASSAAWAEDLDDAIRDYQGDRGLKVDGYLRPDGPTIQALGADRAGEQAKPDPFAPAPAPAPTPTPAPTGAASGRAPANLLNLDGLAPTPRAPKQTIYAATPTERALSNAGYVYRPDPMGRIGKGDWLDERGNALGEMDKRRIAGLAAVGVADPVGLVAANEAAAKAEIAGVERAEAAAQAGAQAGFWDGLRRRIAAAARAAERNEEPTAVALPTAPARVGSVADLQLVAAAVTGALQDVAVRRALRGERLSANDVEAVARAVLASADAVRDRAADPERLADMLARRARNIHAPGEERRRAGDLAVAYREARERAAAELGPEGAGDGRMTAALAAADTADRAQRALGGHSWFATWRELRPDGDTALRPADIRAPAPGGFPTPGDEGGDADEFDDGEDGVVPAGEGVEGDAVGGNGDEIEGGKGAGNARKPRGMHNYASKGASFIGQLHHDFKKWYVEEQKKSGRKEHWKTNPVLEKKIGTGFLVPDFAFKFGEKLYIIELKPDTKFGRLAGEFKRWLYSHYLQARVRIIYYDPKTLPPNSFASGSGPKLGGGSASGAKPATRIGGGGGGGGGGLSPTDPRLKFWNLLE